MDLSIQKLTKAYNRKTIFKELTFHVRSGSRFAITGPNGSGKSTLLKILSGGALPSSGNIIYTHNTNNISSEDIFRYVHFVAPYNTVIEELSLAELFHLHQRLGLLRQFDRFEDWSSRLDYTFIPTQQIKMFSSGMKQRVKLGLALLDDRSLIFLDEPGSNLDVRGKEWLAVLIKGMDATKTIIIASNDPAEIVLCQDTFDLLAN